MKSGLGYGLGGTDIPGNRSYDTAGRVSATELANYGYDAAGRITSLAQQLYRPSDNNPANSGISLGTNSWTVGYDPVGRITSFIDTTAATTTTGPGTATVSYDSNGNRNASTQSTTAGTATSTTRSYNVAAASNRLLGYTQTAVVSGSTSTSTVSYAYNAAGDITSQGSKTFSFNAEQRLSSMATGPTVTSPTTYYTHNALGQRVFKTEPTTGTATTATNGFAYVYDEDGTLRGEYGTGGSASTGTTEYIWLPTPNGPMPIATVVNGTVLSVHTDHLNTPRMLSNKNAQAVWQWKYSAFGDEQPTLARNRFANTATNPNPGTTTVAPVTFNLRYPGQYADAESGLNYNYFRSYDSNSGRYTQADPIGLDGGANLFGYVQGNSLSRSDFLGLQIVFVPGQTRTVPIDPFERFGPSRPVPSIPVPNLPYPNMNAPGGTAFACLALGVSAANWMFSKAKGEKAGAEVEIPPEKKIPIPKVSGKDGAKDYPSWAAGERPNVGESGKDFADRLLGDKYGAGGYKKGAGTEHSQIQKWGDRSFADPKPKP